VTGPSGNACTAATASREIGLKWSEIEDGGAAPPKVTVPLNAPAEVLMQAAKAGAGASRGLPPSIYGALDLGTNNCRLLIARPSRRGFLVIDAFSRIIRLGEGVMRTGRLSEPAMQRTIEALKVCAEKMRRRGVSRSRLISTEACRIASNSGEFIERVRRETGLAIEIVSQETEAKLAVSGCASLVDAACERVLVFDIGGGSSELVWLDLRRLSRPWRRSIYDRLDVQECIAAWTSLPLGVVSLAERHGGHDVTHQSYEAMVADVITAIAPFEAKHRFAERNGDASTHFIGTSGTVTTIAGIHLGLPIYDRLRVDGSWLGVDEVRAVSSRLTGMHYAERVAQPCIGQERADLVLAGCAILEAMLRMWPCTRLRVADRGLREGILATLMAEDGHHARSGRRSRGRLGEMPRFKLASRTPAEP
jgi:exopolyphosphatase/guanosine-5'-triphosphate,3'-diphosphate pyrophosphatase